MAPAASSKQSYQPALGSINELELARALPSGLAHYASKGAWRTAPHLNYLTKKLVDLEQRRIKRLIVDAPPRHGKSDLCSQYFPAWYMGRHPDHQIILASYASGFATQWGERTRDCLTAVGEEVFGVTVHPRRNAAGNWQVLGHQGTMRCAGTQTGGVMGRGAHLLIIDDPIKDAAEAASEAYRDRAWNWYSPTIRSRLEPDAIVMVIQTRWHQDDIVGRLLKAAQAGGEQWDEVTFRALAEEDDVLGRQPGEALWPWRYSREDLLAIKGATPEHFWNALYQQRPTTPGGSIAKETWFPIVTELPPVERLRFCRYWDCGGGQNGEGDPTVGALVAMDRETKKFYIVDIIRVFYTSGEVDNLIRQTAALDGPNVVIREEQEGGSAGHAVIAQRTQRLAGYNYRGKPATQAKELNWMPYLIQAELGSFAMMKATPRWTGNKHESWNQTYIAEILAAPNGEHDDQMDAVAGAFNELTLGAPIQVVELEMG